MDELISLQVTCVFFECDRLPNSEMQINYGHFAAKELPNRLKVLAYLFCCKLLGVGVTSCTTGRKPEVCVCVCVPKLAKS